MIGVKNSLSNVFEMNDVVISNEKVSLYNRGVKADENEAVMKSLSNNYKASLEMIENAKREADSMLVDARKKGNEIGHREGFEKGRKEGYEKGFEKGRADAEKKVMDEFAALFNEASEIKSSILLEKEKILNETKNDTLELAVSIAEKILQYEIDNNDRVIEGILQTVLDQYITEGSEKIFISSLNEDVILDVTDKKTGMNADIEIMKVNHLKKSDLFLQTDRGNINAGIEAQMKRLKAILADIRDR